MKVTAFNPTVILRITIFLVSICVASCHTINKTEKNTDLKTELYFGLSDTEGEIPFERWRDFRQTVLQKHLRGFTELQANGFWSDSIGYQFFEKSVVVIYMHKNTQSENLKIDSLIQVFKKEFNQESVLKTQMPVTISFK